MSCETGAKCFCLSINVVSKLNSYIIAIKQLLFYFFVNYTYKISKNFTSRTY